MVHNEFNHSEFNYFKFYSTSYELIQNCKLYEELKAFHTESNVLSARYETTMLHSKIMKYDIVHYVYIPSNKHVQTSTMVFCVVTSSLQP